MEIFSVFIFIYLSLHFCNARPIKYKQLIDMTYVYDNTTLHYPVYKDFKIDKLVKGPNENSVTKWFQYEDFSTSTHTGTHMDAPAHGVKGEITIEEIPLRVFFGKAAVIDIAAKSELSPDADVTIDDLMNWESTTGKSLNGKIVLLNSGWGHKWKDRDAFLGTSTNDFTKLHFPGFSPEACQWLVENRRIKGIGSDTASLDKGTSTTFLCHAYILRQRIYILENVANVFKLPIHGAKLYVFPMKIGKGSAAPVRIVAYAPMLA